MRQFDELCLICGISAIPPDSIWTDESFGIKDLCKKLRKYDPEILNDLKIDEDGLQDILHRAFNSDPSDHPAFDDTSVWSWPHFRDGIAIGQPLHEEDDDISGKIPDGVDVQTAIVRGAEYGRFGTFVLKGPVQDGAEPTEVVEQRVTYTASNNYSSDSREHGFGNFWVSEGCFHYLQAWIDFEGLPRPSHSRPLSFAGELYEVVNSREDGRWDGVVPWMSYDGIDNTLDQCQYEYYLGLRKPDHMLAAMRRLASSEEIHSAMIRDYRCWMFHAPDIWPTATERHTTTDKTTCFPDTYGTSLTLGQLSQLLPECLVEALTWLPDLRSYLALAQTSKSFFNLLSDSNYFRYILREMASDPSRCLYWIRPVSALGEVGKANQALSTWISEPSSSLGPSCPLDDTNFPYIPFIRACYESDSMRNRQRLWGQVKQFEEVWRDYRAHGWIVDRFRAPPSVV
ncbi:hypothetical protein B0H34DRAFT_860014 [Crassisporium funariophilum]|nr:hypothetical protein B0H34DRAFT_860014 [Crassisporium funariophilum]